MATRLGQRTGGRRSPSVRTKVLGSVVVIAAIGMAVAETASYVVQSRRLDARIDAALRQELEHVREQGYAVAVDELEIGLTALAAPIRNAHGDVIASISVLESTSSARSHSGPCPPG